MPGYGKMPKGTYDKKINAMKESVQKQAMPKPKKKEKK